MIGKVDHHMIPIDGWSDDPEGAEFKVHTNILIEPLNDLLKDMPFSTVSIFSDGHEIRMMRDAVIEVIDERNRRVILVRFLDEGLNELTRMMRGRSGEAI